MCRTRSLARRVGLVVLLAATTLLSSARALPSGGASSLELDIQPLSAHPGDTITFDTTGGLGNSLCALYIAQWGFTPLFLRVTVGLFDGTGEWKIQGTVPRDPSLQDVDITFVSYGIAPSGKLESSNYVTVFFNKN